MRQGTKFTPRGNLVVIKWVRPPNLTPMRDFFLAAEGDRRSGRKRKLDATSGPRRAHRGKMGNGQRAQTRSKGAHAQ